MSELTKEDKLELVSILIVREHLQSPHKKLNIQKIAQNANVSRAWIYKYFGSTEKDIILTTIDCLASQLTETSLPKEKLKSRKDWAKLFLKGIDRALQDVENFPDLFRFYIMTKMYLNEFSDRFKYHEELYFEKRAIPLLKEVFGVGTAEARTMAEMIHGLRIGIAIRWLQEVNKTPAGRAKIINTIKVRVFDQYKD